MNCSKCGNRLEVGDIDSRTEWVKTYYEPCEDCGRVHMQRTDYKTQSSLVESDILYWVQKNDRLVRVG